MRKVLFITLAAVAGLLLPGNAFALASSLNGTTSASLNSNTSSADYGNEANFLRVKNSNSPSPGFTTGVIDIDSEAVLLQAFVSNSSTTEASHNTTVKITLPTGFATLQTATATLSSSNAGALTDSVRMEDSQPFGLEFDQNAQVYVAQRSGSGNNNYVNTATSNYQISGNVMTINLGDWAGGPNQQGLVTVRVLVTRGSTAPALVCTELSKSTSTDTFTATSGVNNANVSGYTFTTTNSSGQVVNTITSTSNAYNFNQTAPGTYTVTAVVNTDKGSSPVGVCTKQITVAQPATLAASTTTTVTPAKTAIPNTGVGNVMGLFAGASALGTAGHFAVRRYRQN